MSINCTRHYSMFPSYSCCPGFTFFPFHIFFEPWLPQFQLFYLNNWGSYLKCALEQGRTWVLKINNKRNSCMEDKEDNPLIFVLSPPFCASRWNDGYSRPSPHLLLLCASWHAEMVRIQRNKKELERHSRGKARNLTPRQQGLENNLWIQGHF